MTHGSVRVEGRDGNFIHLHTTHDGHTGNLEDCVLYIPHYLYSKMSIEDHRCIRFFPDYRKDIPEPPLSEEEELEIEKMFFEDLKYDATACMCDQQSLSSYLISYHQDYLMPVPKTSDMLDYWDYGSEEVVTVYAYPNEDHYILDSTPVLEVYEDTEEMLEHLKKRVEEINEKLGRDYYEMDEDGTVTIPMKKVISRLFCLDYQDELFVPETLYLKTRYKNTFNL